MLTVTNEWTVAYRRPGEPVFHRVLSLHLTWCQAVDLSGLLLEAMPEGTEVWHVTTALYDASRVTEDSFNILVDGETNTRVPMIEDGVLPESLASIDPATLTRTAELFAEEAD